MTRAVGLSTQRYGSGEVGAKIMFRQMMVCTNPLFPSPLQHTPGNRDRQTESFLSSEPVLAYVKL